MKQIEIKDIEFDKHYVTTIRNGEFHCVVTIRKTIDSNNKIVFKDRDNFTYDIMDLNVSKIGKTTNNTIYALNYFKDSAAAAAWCAFENLLNI